MSSKIAAPYLARLLFFLHGRLSADEYDAFVARYNETHRAYHNLDHLGFNMLYAEKQGIDITNPLFLETNAYHDIIYDVGETTNEHLSASYYRRAVTNPNLGVINTILASSNHWDWSKDDILADWSKEFLDADLLGFVYNPRINSLKILLECLTEYDISNVIKGRIKFFENIIDRNMYRTLDQRYNVIARNNIKLELNILQSINSASDVQPYLEWLQLPCEDVT